MKNSEEEVRSKTETQPAVFGIEEKRAY